LVWKRAIVQEGGRLELIVPEFPAGTELEVALEEPMPELDRMEALRAWVELTRSVDSQPGPRLTEDEIQAEIDAYRAEQQRLQQE